LTTVDEALAVVGVPAVVGVLVADVDLDGLVVAALGLAATMGATVEMLLIFMIACLSYVQQGTYQPGYRQARRKL
jgi:hypothetical protein